MLSQTLQTLMCFNVLPGNVPISIEIMPLILHGKMHEKRLVVGVIFSEVAGKLPATSLKTTPHHKSFFQPSVIVNQCDIIDGNIVR